MFDIYIYCPSPRKSSGRVVNPLTSLRRCAPAFPPLSAAAIGSCGPGYAPIERQNVRQDRQRQADLHDR